MQIQIWEPGDKIKKNRFEIIKELGRGGFGITYLAEDIEKGQRIVIKTLNAAKQSEPDFTDTQERFMREGFTLKAFDHTHIVKVYEPIHVDLLWGLVMEYVPGQDLGKYTRAKGSLSEPEAIGYIDQIAQALDYVHHKNFFHRDVKPDNIMLREGQREAVLIDFGLAREYLEEQTIYLSNTLGTELYKPIEQYQKRGRFGPYTDVYALTVTLYCLLTGSPPGGGGRESISYTSIVRKKNHDMGVGEERDKPLWRELVRAGVSERTQKAIKLGMQVEPNQRPQTMTKFRELLGLVNSSNCVNPQSGLSPISHSKNISEASLPQLQVLEQHSESLLPSSSSPSISRSKKVPLPQISREVGNDSAIISLKSIVNLPQNEGFNENLGKGIKLEMLHIPAGEFWMGSSDEEFSQFLSQAQHDLQWNDKQVEDFLKVYDERPRHLVRIKAGYMSKYQITQSQYKLIMNGDNPSTFSELKNLPVDSVSWDDAIEFCKKLSKKTGKKYTLPSEGQWEYACRARSETPFNFGATITPIMANYNYNYTYGSKSQEKYQYRRETTPVGTCGKPNQFGLCDMHGNLSEWCLDSWHNSYNGAPPDGSAWIDRGENNQVQERLLRGGSWNKAPRDCRSASRDKNKANYRHNCNGFRVWQSIDE
jgi:formylglycine-generating enzyme required for sulfatase activity